MIFVTCVVDLEIVGPGKKMIADTVFQLFWGGRDVNLSGGSVPFTGLETLEPCHDRTNVLVLGLYLVKCLLF